MVLFSVAELNLLFIRERERVKKMTKVSTSAPVCCQSCTFASNLQLFCHKTNLHVKKKSKSLQHRQYFKEQNSHYISTQTGHVGCTHIYMLPFPCVDLTK